jgi:hypothetical protein
MTSSPDLHQLLSEGGLAERAARIDDHLARLQWGSAFVIVGISGAAIVAIAPLFRALPTGREQAFLRKLLEHNAYMGGMASFALQPDGWIVLHAGRAVKGIDGNELATMVAAVGKFADQFDDQLIAEFFASQPEATNQVPSARTGVDASGEMLPQTD